MMFEPENTFERVLYAFFYLFTGLLSVLALLWIVMVTVILFKLMLKTIGV